MKNIVIIVFNEYANEQLLYHWNEIAFNHKFSVVYYLPNDKLVETAKKISPNINCHVVYNFKDPKLVCATLLEHYYNSGFQNVLFVNAHCGNIDRAILKAGLMYTLKNDLVFGKVQQGNFYMLGLGNITPEKLSSFNKLQIISDEMVELFAKYNDLSLHTLPKVEMEEPKQSLFYSKQLESIKFY
jgi:hypothetical protein